MLNKTILKGLHQSFHLGAESTYEMASRLLEGKNVIKALKIIKRCEVCQKNNPKTEKLATKWKVSWRGLGN